MFLGFQPSKMMQDFAAIHSMNWVVPPYETKKSSLYPAEGCRLIAGKTLTKTKTPRAFLKWTMTYSISPSLNHETTWCMAGAFPRICWSIPMFTWNDQLTFFFGSVPATAGKQDMWWNSSQSHYLTAPRLVVIRHFLDFQPWWWKGAAMVGVSWVNRWTDWSWREHQNRTPWFSWKIAGWWFGCHFWHVPIY